MNYPLSLHRRDKPLREVLLGRYPIEAWKKLGGAKLDPFRERIEALRIADTFRARTLDSTLDSFVFEVTGNSSKVDAFVNLMRSLGSVEVARTGVSAISRGNNIDLEAK